MTLSKILAPLLPLCFSAMFAIAAHAQPDLMTGSWILNEADSQTLASQLKDLRQEERDFKTEHGGINDPDKPEPFKGRKFGDKEWESRRAGMVSDASVNATTILESEALKLYFSDRVIVSYEGTLRRRLNPNPAGRVYSATGRGVSKDAIGETLAYLDGDAFVIETRLNTAERLVERFELTADGELKITINLKNPDWRRELEFVRYFARS